MVAFPNACTVASNVCLLILNGSFCLSAHESSYIPLDGLPRLVIDFLLVDVTFRFCVRWFSTDPLLFSVALCDRGRDSCLSCGLQAVDESSLVVFFSNVSRWFSKSNSTSNCCLCVMLSRVAGSSLLPSAVSLFVSAPLACVVSSAGCRVCCAEGHH